MQTGTAISGALHVGLIAFVILNGSLSAHPPPDEVVQVSVVSSADYAALIAGDTPPEAEATPAVLPVPEAPTAPPQEPAVTADPALDRPDPVALQRPEPVQPRPPETPPRTAPATPAEVADTVPDIAPPQPGSDAVALLAPAETPPAPARPADGSAPRPAPPAPMDAQPDAVDTAPPAPAVSAAPKTSIRPVGRPSRPAPQSAPVVETAAAAPKAAPQTPSRDQAVDAAVAAALAAAGAAPQANPAPPRSAPGPVGPPLTGGEREALRVAVSQCWNVGSLSSAALATTVTVGMNMTPDGRPVANSIRLIGFDGGNESAAQQAFGAARRAIIRCGGQGFSLPPDKYDRWQEIEMTFNPEKMQYR